MYGIPAPHLLTAAQIQALEHQMFGWGMPVAALMEKVGLRAADLIQQRYPRHRCARVGILVGMGHNGGDGLVVARELLLAGYQIKVWQGSHALKPLVANHAAYLRSMGDVWVEALGELADCDLLIDGLFGIGLSRGLEDPWAAAVRWANHSGLPVVSLDLPSGLSADSGSPLGPCIRAELTLCLGLWKRGLWQDPALEWVGEVVGIDFGAPAQLLASLETVQDQASVPRLICPTQAQQWIPRPPQRTHKYQQGHLLIVAGSHRYAGAAVLAVLGSRGSGAGMVTVAVPQSLKALIHQWAPEVLVWPCQETALGEIANLGELDPTGFQAIVVGPGLGSEPKRVLQPLRDFVRDRGHGIPMVMDADGINGLAAWGIDQWQALGPQTVFTPHEGEFRRLWGDIDLTDRIRAAQQAALTLGTTVLLKGSRTVITGSGGTWVNPQSTPALARGGSGDVLTGLLGGLLAQGLDPLVAAALAAWWHSQAARLVAAERGLTGVDPVALAAALPRIPQPRIHSN